MFWVILGLSMVLTMLAAYTLAIQKTTYIIGRLLANKSPEESGSGVQDAITPKMQNARNLAIFALIILVFGLTTYQYAWYHGLWVIVVCFMGSSIITIAFGLQPGSSYLVALIVKDLKNRQQSYHDSGDNLRSQLISTLIEKLEHLSPEEISREAVR